MAKLSDLDKQAIYEVSESIGDRLEAVTAERGAEDRNLILLASICTPAVAGLVVTLEEDDLLRDLWDGGPQQITFFERVSKQQKFRACWAVWISTISSRILSEEPANVQDDMLSLIASVFIPTELHHTLRAESYERLWSEVSAFRHARKRSPWASSMILRIRLANALEYPGVEVPEGFANRDELKSTNPELIPLIDVEKEMALGKRVQATLDQALNLIKNKKSGGSGCLLPIPAICVLLLLGILGIAIS